MITCLIRYDLDLAKTAEFEQYARTWMRLIEKYGGTHHGYFVPTEAPAGTNFSFSDLGRSGPDDVGIALFSFPTVDSYNDYRRAVADDPECEVATKRRNETECFTGYERTFLLSVNR